jgi:hypothetical protein
MFPSPRSVVALPRPLATLAALICVLALAGCGTITTSPPAPTPAGFQVIAGLLRQGGLTIEHIVSGDAGCDDHTLAQTAIALDASGLDQAAPTRLYIYIFRNGDSFTRLRQTVDVCAKTYTTNPEDFESIDASPYVVAGPGPWAPGFKAAIRTALTNAAGTGG